MSEETEFALSDPDNDNAPENGIAKSLTRSWALERSKNVLSKYWLFGTGRDAVAMWGWGYQSSHNIIIDAILCYGVIGSIAYLALWILPVVWVWKITNERKKFSLYVMGFVIVLMYSMLQPILNNKLLVVLLIWGSLAIYIPDKNNIES